jgi:hypothetical protein
VPALRYNTIITTTTLHLQEQSLVVLLAELPVLP